MQTKAGHGVRYVVPQQLRKDGAVLTLLFRQFFKHNAKLPIRRPGQIFRHAPPGPVIAPFQQFFRILLFRLPELQVFSVLAGQQADSRQCRPVGLFSPVQLHGLLPLPSRQLRRQAPVDSRQFHGLPLQLPQVIPGRLFPGGPYPLPDLLLRGPILFVQMNPLLPYQYSR